MILKFYVSLAFLNRILSLICFLTGGYILIVPNIPNLEYQIAQASEEPQQIIYESQLASSNISNLNIDFDNLKPVPAVNTLVIPTIGVDGAVHEGGKEVLDLGLWRRPNTSTPDKGGNTVVIAHRYLFKTGGSTFYHLDKVEIGDVITYFWQGKEYNYEVYDIFEVEPHQVEIEYDTEEPILTLYTCTPLYTADRRLVVRASLIV